MTYAINNNTMSLSDWQKQNVDVEYKFHEPEPTSITFHTGVDEMIRVAEDGFYIRGKKVEQDDKEAETVYNAFKQWLAWAQLQRN